MILILRMRININILRFAPLLLLGLFGAVALLGRMLLQLRQHGSLGLSLFRGSRRERGMEAAAVLLPLGFVALAWLAALAPGQLRLWSFAARPEARLAGAGWMAAALAAIFVAQLQMGASWRIGIDSTARPGLVTHGLYRFSRNPIYALLLAALAGFVVLLPTWPSLLLFAGTLATLRVQISREEAYLLATYGDEFRAYRRRVRRFF